MQPITTIIISLTLIVLLLLSSFFSFSEMAIASSNKIRLKTFAKFGTKLEKKQSTRVLKLTKSYNEIITSIVVWNNIVNVLSSSLATLWMTSLLGSDIGFLIAFLGMTILIIIFGELVPKMLAKKYSERGVMFFSIPLVITNYSMKPITFLLKRIVKENANITLLQTEQELTEAHAEATTTGIISNAEYEIINKALKLDEIKAKQIMIPLNDVATISKNSSPTKLKETVIKYNHTRFPILSSNGVPTGIFNSKKYVIRLLETGKSSISKSTYSFQSFSKETIVHKIFDDLRFKREHMALIVSKQKKLLGIITIEDIIEEIFGELYDETDVEKDGIYKITESRYLLKPEASANLFFKKYLKNKSKKYKTDVNLSIYDWVKNNLKKEPKINDVLSNSDFIIWIKEDNYEKQKIIFEIDII